MAAADTSDDELDLDPYVLSLLEATEAIGNGLAIPDEPFCFNVWSKSLKDLDHGFLQAFYEEFIRKSEGPKKPKLDLIKQVFGVMAGSKSLSQAKKAALTVKGFGKAKYELIEPYLFYKKDSITAVQLDTSKKPIRVWRPLEVLDSLTAKHASTGRNRKSQRLPKTTLETMLEAAQAKSSAPASTTSHSGSVAVDSDQSTDDHIEQEQTQTNPDSVGAAAVPNDDDDDEEDADNTIIESEDSNDITNEASNSLTLKSKEVQQHLSKKLQWALKTLSNAHWQMARIDFPHPPYMLKPTDLDYHFSHDYMQFWDVSLLKSQRSCGISCVHDGCDGKLTGHRNSTTIAAWSRGVRIVDVSTRSGFLYSRKLNCTKCNRIVNSSHPIVLAQLPEHDQRAFKFLIGDKPTKGLAYTQEVVQASLHLLQSSGSFNDFTNSLNEERARRIDLAHELYLLRQQMRVARPTGGQGDIRDAQPRHVVEVKPFRVIVSLSGSITTATLTKLARRHAEFRIEPILSAMIVGAVQTMTFAAGDHTYKIILRKTNGGLHEAVLTLVNNTTGQPVFSWMVGSSSALELAQQIEVITNLKSLLSTTSLTQLYGKLPCQRTALDAGELFAVSIMRHHGLATITDRVSTTADLQAWLEHVAPAIKGIYLDNCCSFRPALRSVLPPPLAAIPKEQRLSSVNPLKATVISTAHFVTRQEATVVYAAPEDVKLLSSEPSFLTETRPLRQLSSSEVELLAGITSADRMVFDLEWSRSKGVDVIQLGAIIDDEPRFIVIHIPDCDSSSFNEWPLRMIKGCLEDQDKASVGFSTGNDKARLAQLGIDLKGLVDLAKLDAVKQPAKEVFGRKNGRIALDKIAQYLWGQERSKHPNLANFDFVKSNVGHGAWHLPKLSAQHQFYAALDIIMTFIVDELVRGRCQLPHALVGKIAADVATIQADLDAIDYEPACENIKLDIFHLDARSKACFNEKHSQSKRMISSFSRIFLDVSSTSIVQAAEAARRRDPALSVDDSKKQVLKHKNNGALIKATPPIEAMQAKLQRWLDEAIAIKPDPDGTCLLTVDTDTTEPKIRSFVQSVATHIKLGCISDLPGEPMYKLIDITEDGQFIYLCFRASCGNESHHKVYNNHININSNPDLVAFSLLLDGFRLFLLAGKKAGLYSKLDHHDVFVASRLNKLCLSLFGKRPYKLPVLDACLPIILDDVCTLRPTVGVTSEESDKPLSRREVENAKRRFQSAELQCQPRAAALVVPPTQFPAPNPLELVPTQHLATAQFAFGREAQPQQSQPQPQPQPSQPQIQQLQPQPQQQPQPQPQPQQLQPQQQQQQQQPQLQQLQIYSPVQQMLPLSSSVQAGSQLAAMTAPATTQSTRVKRRFRSNWTKSELTLPSNATSIVRQRYKQWCAMTTEQARRLVQGQPCCRLCDLPLHYFHDKSITKRAFCPYTGQSTAKKPKTSHL